MIDLSSLFSVSDNFYKFLFVGGILMIFFSISYPIQKQQDIDIEINTYNQQADLLNKDIIELNKRIKVFKNTKNLMLDTINSIKNDRKIRPINKQSYIAKIKKNYSVGVINLTNQQQLNQTKNILIKYNKAKIEILKEHVTTYKNYAIGLTIGGILISIIGGVFWAISTYNTEQLKIKEIRRNP